MKYYVFTLLFVVGLVSGASAANDVDPSLFGTWRSFDGPCSPCELTIQSGGVTFTQVRSSITVIQAIGTNGPGIHVFLQGGGELDLEITKKSNRLVGRYSSWSGTISNQSVVFDLTK